jgi:hypothetical protein
MAGGVLAAASLLAGLAVVATRERTQPAPARVALQATAYLDRARELQRALASGGDDVSALAAYDEARETVVHNGRDSPAVDRLLAEIAAVHDLYVLPVIAVRKAMTNIASLKGDEAELRRGQATAKLAERLAGLDSALARLASSLRALQDATKS